MAYKAEIGAVSFRPMDARRRFAVVRFDITSGDTVPPAVADFSIEITVHEIGDIANVVDMAKRALHNLTGGLALAVEEWVERPG